MENKGSRDGGSGERINVETKDTSEIDEAGRECCSACAGRTRSDRKTNVLVTGSHRLPDVVMRVVVRAAAATPVQAVAEVVFVAILAVTVVASDDGCYNLWLETNPTQFERQHRYW